MPGILVTSGMDLRLSNIKIPLDGSDPPPVAVHVRSDSWPHWLLAACDNTETQTVEEGKLQDVLAREKAGEQLNDEKGRALESESRPAMTAVAACAFAIDAFYSTMVARFGKHPDAQAWKKNRTARPAQIAATLQYHLKLREQGNENLRRFTKELFGFRDRAVHPPTDFVQPVHREDVDAGVEPRFITFSAQHARTVLSATVYVMTQLIDKAKYLAEGDTQKWVEFAQDRIAQVREAAIKIDGVDPSEGEGHGAPSQE